MEHKSSTSSSKSNRPHHPTPGQIQRAKLRRERLQREAIQGKRIMLVSTLSAAGGIFVWIVSIATDGWYNTSHNATLANFNGTEDFVTNSHTGLWRHCRVISEEEICIYHKLFPSREEVRRNPELDEHVIDYRRTQLVFALLSIMLMLLALLASFYTFKNGRYMYKRLAAGLSIICAACILITLEAVVTSLRHEVINVPTNFPTGSIVSYSYSFYMGWSVFLIYLIHGGVFLVYSRKKKWLIDDQDNVL